MNNKRVIIKKKARKFLNNTKILRKKLINVHQKNALIRLLKIFAILIINRIDNN